MTLVPQIIADWLRSRKLDGLCNNRLECGCMVGDLAPCGQICEDCQAGVLLKQNDTSGWKIVPFIVTPGVQSDADMIPVLPGAAGCQIGACEACRLSAELVQTIENLRAAKAEKTKLYDAAYGLWHMAHDLPRKERFEAWRDETKVRARFEAWLATTGYAHARSAINHDEYLDGDTQAAWCGWKASVMGYAS